jgi:hypothetical protein
MLPLIILTVLLKCISTSILSECLTGDELIGLFLLEQHLISDNYPRFQTNKLFLLMEGVPLETSHIGGAAFIMAARPHTVDLLEKAL